MSRAELRQRDGAGDDLMFDADDSLPEFSHELKRSLVGIDDENDPVRVPELRL